MLDRMTAIKLANPNATGSCTQLLPHTKHSRNAGHSFEAQHLKMQQTLKKSKAWIKIKQGHSTSKNTAKHLILCLMVQFFRSFEASLLNLSQEPTPCTRMHACASEETSQGVHNWHDSYITRDPASMERHGRVNKNTTGSVFRQSVLVETSKFTGPL